MGKPWARAKARVRSRYRSTKVLCVDGIVAPGVPFLDEGWEGEEDDLRGGGFDKTLPDRFEVGVVFVEGDVSCFIASRVVAAELHEDVVGVMGDHVAVDARQAFAGGVAARAGVDHLEVSVRNCLWELCTEQVQPLGLVWLPASEGNGVAEPDDGCLLSVRHVAFRYSRGKQ